MILLGLSAGFHDSAAALVVDGEVVAAVEEERLSRIKHDATFPAAAADSCVEIAGVGVGDIDGVVFHEKPLDVLHRHMTSRVAAGPSALGPLLTRTPRVVRDQLSVPLRINRWFRRRGGRAPAVHYCEHHTSHLAAAFYPSPFARAAVLAVDGVGEWATCSLGDGNGRHLDVESELRFPHSIGLLYSAFASYCGFRVNSGEGELMGLAPFGTPRYADRIRDHLVHPEPDGSFRIDLGYFDFPRGSRMTNVRFHDLFDGPPRPIGSEPGRREADLAASIQVVTEELLLGLALQAHRTTGASALCLAGGVALNCVANSRLLRESPFDELWVQPAAGDAGSAIGAALWTYHETLGRPRRVDPDDAMAGAFLGPGFSASDVRAELDSLRIEHRRVPDPVERCRIVAERLAAGDVVGWFAGRMEFGPRALGHRSIVADARSAEVQGRINGMVKERASFRPFAPAVLADRYADWFEPGGGSPYMTATAAVIEGRRCADADDGAGTPAERVAHVRSQIPAVTHVDASARVQLVDARRNPEFELLLRQFDELTGCPVLLNTSFNRRDEPIVCTPTDAVRTAQRAGLDLLVIEDCLVERAEVPS